MPQKTFQQSLQFDAEASVVCSTARVGECLQLQTFMLLVQCCEPRVPLQQRALSAGMPCCPVCNMSALCATCQPCVQHVSHVCNISPVCNMSAGADVAHHMLPCVQQRHPMDRLKCAVCSGSAHNDVSTFLKRARCRQCIFLQTARVCRQHAAASRAAQLQRHRRRVRAHGQRRRSGGLVPRRGADDCPRDGAQHGHVCFERAGPRDAAGAHLVPFRLSPFIRESALAACGLSVCCCQKHLQGFTKLYRITMAQHGNSDSVRGAAWRGRVWEQSRGMGVLFRAHQWHPPHPQLNVSTMRLRVYRATRACVACR